MKKLFTTSLFLLIIYYGFGQSLGIEYKQVHLDI